MHRALESCEAMSESPQMANNRRMQVRHKQRWISHLVSDDFRPDHSLIDVILGRGKADHDRNKELLGVPGEDTAQVCMEINGHPCLQKVTTRSSQPQ